MSMFNGSSVSASGTKSLIGAFGTTTQLSPFGGSFEASSQPAFGASSTPAFSSSPFGASSQPSFDAPSTLAFGSLSTPTSCVTSTPEIKAPHAPAFGATSTPAFGSTSNPTLGTTSFTFAPAFGCIPFGATSTAFGAQSSPSGGQATTSASGNPGFGQPSAFGSSSISAVGSASTPASGATTAPTFGATSISTTAFGSTSTPTFGTTGSTSVPNIFGTPGLWSSTPSHSSPFGAATSNSFGLTPTPSPFGRQTTTPACGASSTPGFGSSTTPAFGSSPTLAFGATSSPFSIGSIPAFGLSTSAFGSNPFGTTNTAVGAQSSSFGGQTTTTAFGSPGFGQPSFGGQQRGGTRVTPYCQTTEADSGNVVELKSISAMPAYKEKSHEELRWEDYQLGDKGTPIPAAQSYGIGLNFGSTLSSPLVLSITPTLGQTSSPFGHAAPIFKQSTPAFGQSNAFGGNVSSLFRQSTPAFGHSNAFARNMFSSTPSLLSTISMEFNHPTPSFSMPFQSIQSTQNTGGFSFGVPAGGVGGTTSAFDQYYGQSSASQNPTFAQPQSTTNPFGTLPATVQISVGGVGNAPSLQSGLTSLPVKHEILINGLLLLSISNA